MRKQSALSKWVNRLANGATSESTGYCRTCLLQIVLVRVDLIRYSVRISTGNAEWSLNGHIIEIR